MGWMDIADLVLKAGAPALANISKGQAADRSAQAVANNSRDQINERAQTDYQKALNDRAELEAKLQSDNYKKQAQADMLQHWSPVVRPKGVANVSFIPGGAPSQDMLDRAADLKRMATIKLLGGSGLPDVKQFTATPLPQESSLSKALGIMAPAAAAGSGILGQILKDKKGVLPTVSDVDSEDDSGYQG